MKLLKRLGLALTAVVFCLSLSAVSANAQPGRAGWKGNNGKHKGWYKGERRGWDNGRKTGWDDRYNQNRSWRNRNITPQEYRRLSRQRNRIYNTTNRYYRDGYLNVKERNKLQKRYTKYRRSVNRARSY